MTFRRVAAALICTAVLLVGCSKGGGGGPSGALPTGSWDSMSWDQAVWG